MQSQMLNFMVTSTCEVLGITFTGTTEEEKREFVEKHIDARRQAVDKLLNEAYQEMINQDGEV